MYGYPASGTALNQVPTGAVPADGGLQRGMKPFQTSNGGTGYFQVPVLPGGGLSMGMGMGNPMAAMGAMGPMGAMAAMGGMGGMGGMMGGGAPMMPGMPMGSMGGGTMSPYGGYSPMMGGQMPQMPQAQSGAQQVYKGQSYQR